MARTAATRQGAGEAQIDVRSRAWRTFLEAHAAVIPLVDQALEREVRLPFTWYDVLFQLAETPGLRRRMGELAEAVLLSRSGLTRLVDRIEAAGFVARQAIPGDRRSSHVVLTEAGQRQLAAALPIATSAIEAYFGSQLSEADARLLVEILGRVRDRASKSQSRVRKSPGPEPRRDR